MNTLLIVVPLLLGIIALGYTITANLLRVWLEHRVKLALLERLQSDGDGVDGLAHLQSLVDGDTGNGRGRPWVDHVVVGVTLAILGAGSILSAWWCGGQGTLTGVYFGGVLCVAVGFILTVLGLITRFLARLPVQTPRG